MEKAFESIIQSISAFYGTTNAKTIDQSILQRFIWLVIIFTGRATRIVTPLLQ